MGTDWRKGAMTLGKTSADHGATRGHCCTDSAQAEGLTVA